jgi:hypothetical protein
MHIFCKYMIGYHSVLKCDIGNEQFRSEPMSERKAGVHGTVQDYFLFKHHRCKTLVPKLSMEM